MGRPFKLNEEVIHILEEEIADGMPIVYACDMVGINEETFRMWMKDGEQDYLEGIETLNAELFRRIKKAYAIFIKDSRIRIRKGVDGWQGTAWWLERTNQLFKKDDGSASVQAERITVNVGMKKNRGT